MPLSPGEKLGPYQVVALLGAGGMGQVYRARDARLDRDVAIKVLREETATSPEFRDRFEREARAVAALNHPNVVGIYDYGVERGYQYFVSELVEGESLRSLLSTGPVPVRRLLEIASQIADGVSAAHAAGVVHRDLKPENIMLAKDGRVKILDFGLARRAIKTAATDETGTILAKEYATAAGQVMGTASYMSPEQAVGKEVDYRSDQFSFGLILYEMAAGEQPFSRDSPVETMAAIVREEASPISEKLPAPLQWCIDRCLQKEPGQRYESTLDLYRDLRTIRDRLPEAYSSAPSAPVAIAEKKSRRWRLPLTAAASLAVGILIAALMISRGQEIGRYRYTPFAVNASSPVWSPDGKTVAYSSAVGQNYQVFLRYPDSAAPVQLTHENFSMLPLGWSSDRSHLLTVLFSRAGRGGNGCKVFSVPTVGGDPEFVMELEDCYVLPALSRDGKALAAFPEGKDGLTHVRTSDPIGSPWKTYAPEPYGTANMTNLPQLAFSPDGKNILLVRAAGGNKEEAWLLPYPAGSGTPYRVLTKLESQYPPSFSWMPDSRHLMLSAAMEANTPASLWMADIRSGGITPVTAGTAMETIPSVSPDGKATLYQQNETHLDVVSVALLDGSAKTLIATGRDEGMPAWAANQEKLVWVSDRNGPMEIWIREADGSERPVVTQANFPPGSNKILMTPSLSPQGDRIAYERIDREGIMRTWISSVSGGAPVRLTNAEPSLEDPSAWSPDGRQFVYLQFEKSNAALAIARTSGNATPVLVKELHDAGDSLPCWSPRGDWITYEDETGWNLVSPDGKNTKPLGHIPTQYLAFSKDGKILYGIANGPTEGDRDKSTLFSLDPATLKQTPIKDLGRSLRPASWFHHSIRLSLSPDGKNVVYSTGDRRSDIWMLQGYQQPGWWNGFPWN
jgi:serine/threonine protein kinase